MNPAKANEPAPIVSVVVVNYNCKQWLDRFFSSLRAQTIFDRVEVIIVDNTSKDGSAEICEKEMAGWPNGIFLPTGGNYGFGGGCNRGAAAARGKYFFFLNPDVWFETTCLQELVNVGEQSNATAVAAKILNYADDTVQWWLDDGFDIFGIGVPARAGSQRLTSFCSSTFAFIRADAFRLLGGFDEMFFMYGEEAELAWGIWLSGGHIATAPNARLHHRSEAAVNPTGGERITEFRTSERKRFFTNRNHLLLLLRYSQHILSLTIVAFIGLLFVEGFFWLARTGRWSSARAASLEPLVSCWRLREHVRTKRRQVQTFRKHGDWWMLRFFCWRFGRAVELKKILKFGLPKIN
ncbi:MAG: glycosyltransferase family 2 protein [Limisphaerales bacterium]